MIRILVDADSCPVKEIIVKVAKEFDIPVLMFFDTSHVFEDGYSTTFLVDKGSDNADYALINELHTGDIVVTQDYGLATMVLSKQGVPLNANGLIYTNENILSLLNQRALHQKLRRRVSLKGPKKRTKEKHRHGSEYHLLQDPELQEGRE